MSIFIITGPSGSGKTTIANELVERCASLEKVVTHTTRMQREGEIEGVHYHFVSEGRFCLMQDNGYFVEYAEVYDNMYGTSSKALVDIEKTGKHPLIVTDVQGAEWWKNEYPEDVVTIFLLPPDHDELIWRLTSRGTAAEEILLRTEQTMYETVQYSPQADYIAVNDDIEATVTGIVGFTRTKCGYRD